MVQTLVEVLKSITLCWIGLVLMSTTTVTIHLVQEDLAFDCGITKRLMSLRFVSEIGKVHLMGTCYDTRIMVQAQRICMGRIQQDQYLILHSYFLGISLVYSTSKITKNGAQISTNIKKIQPIGLAVLVLLLFNI